MVKINRTSYEGRSNDEILGDLNITPTELGASNELLYKNIKTYGTITRNGRLLIYIIWHLYSYKSITS